MGESAFAHNIMAVAGQDVADSCQRRLGRDVGWGYSPNRPAVVVREPNNPYDRYAVAVVVNAVQVGYLPRDLAAQVAPVMDARGEATLAGLSVYMVWPVRDRNGRRLRYDEINVGVKFREPERRPLIRKGWLVLAAGVLVSGCMVMAGLSEDGSTVTPVGASPTTQGTIQGLAGQGTPTTKKPATKKTSTPKKTTTTKKRTTTTTKRKRTTSKPPAPRTDPRFGTCRAANAAGYGNYQQGVDPEYYWYQDRDNDGWVCET
jgi:cell division septation protein DedD